jgi:hypothetical protein
VKDTRAFSLGGFSFYAGHYFVIFARHIIVHIRSDKIFGALIFFASKYLTGISAQMRATRTMYFVQIFLAQIVSCLQYQFHISTLSDVAFVVNDSTVDKLSNTGSLSLKENYSP